MLRISTARQFLSGTQHIIIRGMKSAEGQRVPSVTWPVRQNEQWSTISSDEFFKGRRVAVLALPGAFTPTCSTSHLPRYNELFNVFKKNGVDAIACLSVNDTFVMNEWQKVQQAPNITMLPDGNCEFTEKIGMAVNKNQIGFGRRSWRYSMLVNDCVIEKMFIEPEKEGDPYEVSDADTMLKYLNPDAKLPESITMITKEGCPHCTRAKSLLHKHELNFEELVLGRTITSRGLRALSGATSVPQIFVGGKKIGGADELESYMKTL